MRKATFGELKSGSERFIASMHNSHTYVCIIYRHTQCENCENNNWGLANMGEGVSPCLIGVGPGEGAVPFVYSEVCKVGYSIHLFTFVIVKYAIPYIYLHLSLLGGLCPTPRVLHGALTGGLIK